MTDLTADPTSSNDADELEAAGETPSTLTTIEASETSGNEHEPWVTGPREEPEEEESSDAAPSLSEQLRAADAASQARPAIPVGTGVAPCPLAARWAMEVVVSGADGQPLAEVVVAVEKSAGEQMRAKTDATGRARFVGLDGGKVTLAFPELDGAAWELTGSSALANAKVAEPPSWEAPPAADPPAKVTHVIAEGEFVSKLAFMHGHAPDTVWSAPDNASLRASRRHMNVLSPGDAVVIPARVARTETVAAGQEHRVRRVGYPETFRVRFLRADGSARAGLPYLATIRSGGDAARVETREGTTDGDGFVTQVVPLDVEVVEVALGVAEEAELYSFQTGYLDPASTVEGAQERLESLGFDCHGEVGELGPHTARALREFQTFAALEATGALDDATITKLEELYLT